MGNIPRSFKVYGFTIEVHAGGRRVWPPSFKRFIKEKLDNGDLTLAEVMKACNASQSLVYKWRADVKASKIRATVVGEQPIFSEIVLEDDHAQELQAVPAHRITPRSRGLEISLPSTYPVAELISVIRSLDVGT